MYSLIMVQVYITLVTAGPITSVLLTIVHVILRYTTPLKVNVWLCFIFTDHYLLIVHIIPVKGLHIDALVVML